jgi:hypothetical protein
MSENKTRILLDASALSVSSCDYRMKLTLLDGIVPLEQQPAIEYGSAFHRFVAYWREHPSEYAEAAALAQMSYTKVIVPPDDFRDIGHLVKTCGLYADFYSNDPFIPFVSKKDNTPTVELPFSFPIFVDESIELIACGTIDAIGKYDGIPCFTDIKTTSVWNKHSYLESYVLSSQMMFYRWALDKLSKEIFPDTFGEFANLPCFIDAVFLNKSGAFMDRSNLITFSDYLMWQFEQCLYDYISRLLNMVKTRFFPRNGFLNGSCDTKYGKCRFFNICSQTTEEGSEYSKNTGFTVREYNPLNFRV